MRPIIADPSIRSQIGHQGYTFWKSKLCMCCQPTGLGTGSRFIVTFGKESGVIGSYLRLEKTASTCKSAMEKLMEGEYVNKSHLNTTVENRKYSGILMLIVKKVGYLSNFEIW